jgi:hypothetical protein
MRIRVKSETLPAPSRSVQHRNQARLATAPAAVPMRTSARRRARAYLWTMLVQEQAAPSNPMRAVLEPALQTAVVQEPGLAGHPTAGVPSEPGLRRGRTAFQPLLQRYFHCQSSGRNYSLAEYASAHARAAQRTSRIAVYRDRPTIGSRYRMHGSKPQGSPRPRYHAPQL